MNKSFYTSESQGIRKIGTGTSSGVRLAATVDGRYVRDSRGRLEPGDRPRQELGPDQPCEAVVAAEAGLPKIVGRFGLDR